MPGYSEQGALFGSLQRVRREDGAEKIKGLIRASIWAPPTGACVQAGTAGVSEGSKAFQELHCGHQVAPVPVKKSPAGRWQAGTRTAHGA